MNSGLPAICPLCGKNATIYSVYDSKILSCVCSNKIVLFGDDFEETIKKHKEKILQGLDTIKDSDNVFIYPSSDGKDIRIAHLDSVLELLKR